MAQSVYKPFKKDKQKVKTKVFLDISIAHSWSGTLNWAILNRFNISFKFKTVNIDLNPSSEA